MGGLGGFFLGSIGRFRFLGRGLGRREGGRVGVSQSFFFSFPILFTSQVVVHLGRRVHSLSFLSSRYFACLSEHLRQNDDNLLSLFLSSCLWLVFGFFLTSPLSLYLPSSFFRCQIMAVSGEARRGRGVRMSRVTYVQTDSAFLSLRTQRLQKKEVKNKYGKQPQQTIS